MAIEETGTRETIYFSNSATPSITVPADCTLVIVAGAWWDSGAVDQVTAMSIDGSSLTKVTSQENPDSEMETDIWRLVNPSTGAQTLTITCSGAFGLQWTGFVVYYKGINTATPIRASDSEWETNYGADPVATAAITSASGDLMFCLVGSYNIDADAAPTGKGQTEVANYSVGSAYSAFGTKAGASPSVIMWGSGGSCGISACSIQAAVSGYTLTAAGGTYVLSGQAASTLYGRKVGAGAGSYALTGTAANALYGRKVSADAGAYSLTGQTVDLLRGFKLGAGAGAYVLTGQAANLIYSGGAYILACDAGAYVLSGQAAGLLKTHRIVPEAGAYVLTGEDVALLLGRKLSAEAGSIVLTGQDLDLLRGYLIDIDPGTYTITGEDVTLTYSGGVLFAVIFDVVPRERIIDLEPRKRIVDLQPRARIIDYKGSN